MSGSDVQKPFIGSTLKSDLVQLHKNQMHIPGQ